MCEHGFHCQFILGHLRDFSIETEKSGVIGIINFDRLYRQHQEMVSKFNVGFGTLLLQGGLR